MIYEYKEIVYSWIQEKNILMLGNDFIVFVNVHVFLILKIFFLLSIHNCLAFIKRFLVFLIGRIFK